MGTESLTQGTSQFLAFVLTVPNMIVMVGAIGAIRIVQSLWPRVFRSAMAARLLPLVSTVLCMGGVALQGHNGRPVGDIILLGFVLGAFCGKLHKLWKQTVLGHDDRIVKRPKKAKLK